MANKTKTKQINRLYDVIICFVRLICSYQRDGVVARASAL